jgi:hypothetical protein
LQARCSPAVIIVVLIVLVAMILIVVIATLSLTVVMMYTDGASKPGAIDISPAGTTGRERATRTGGAPSIPIGFV